MTKIKVILILTVFLTISANISAQVGIVPLNDPPYFGVKLTHLASHDYALLACDQRSGEVVLRTKQGIVFRSYNYDEILKVSNIISDKFCSFVESTEKKLNIKYELAAFNVRVAKLYKRF